MPIDVEKLRRSYPGPHNAKRIEEWAVFDWPAWMPEELREETAFAHIWHNTPTQFLAKHGNRSSSYNVPPFGEYVTAGADSWIPWVGGYPTTVYGRFVWHLNNIGRIVTDDGRVVVCSFGDNWDRAQPDLTAGSVLPEVLG